MPPLGIVAGRDSAADPAFDLDAENERLQQLNAAHAAQLRQREQRRRDGGSRMDDRPHMRVAKIKHVRSGGVEKGRAQRIDTLAAPDHDRLRAAGKFGERLERNFHRPGAAARKRHGKEIQQCTLGAMARTVGHVLPARAHGEARENLSDGGYMQHGACQMVLSRRASPLPFVLGYSSAACRRPRCRSERSIHSRVSFSCTPF